MRASVRAPPPRREPATMDPTFLTIAELNRLYGQRELSPVEVTRALLDRIAAHDGKLHSFIRVTPEARAIARHTLRAQGHRRNRWHPDDRSFEALSQLCAGRRRPSRDPVEIRWRGVDGQARHLGIRARRAELGPALAAGA